MSVCLIYIGMHIYHTIYSQEPGIIVKERKAYEPEAMDGYKESY